MQKISGVIITLNEERNILYCLRSIYWVDEIVVFDSGSIDNTLVYAKNFTRKIFQTKILNNYAKKRNVALGETIYDWILVLDADERLSANAEKRIRQLIENDSVDGYWFPRRNYISESKYLKHGYFYPDLQLRLFRNNGKIRYSGKIHEQPQIPKGKTKIIHDVVLHHNTSHSKYDSFFHFFRFFPYIRIEGTDVAKGKESTLQLFYDIPIEFLRHLYRSFIKIYGYKDGYAGFRAAFNYALYRSSVQGYALLLRFRK